MVLLQQRPAFLQGRLRDDPANFADVPDFFLAHELAHQWWGHGVAGQNYRELWLSEGAAQFAASLWVRESQGEKVYRDLLERMARWAARHSGEGPINLGNRLGHLKRDPQIYRAVVYDKGAYVLHMLRAIVGEEAFRRGVQEFMSAHRYAKAGTEELREALEKASGQDLSPYFREWIYGTALPVLRFTSRSEPGDGGYRTAVQVVPQALPGSVPLEISVAHKAGTAVETVSLPREGGTFTIQTPTLPRKVDLNRSLALLASVKRL
jgi:aminopeptidase N